ncbi:LysR family transcriptional regulator [Flavobacterium sp. W21_SRS_FM6]|uniref:LysR family transcriptional regulator n=1 Tax=Flavobacterium sp. W21_SRS_FM6 TaxID=3240268 RepID=UPI003F8EBAC9
MNTKQLQYFLATAEQGSITAAARELDVAQPAISLQLANLEHELKIKLFERDFRGVELTEAGRCFEEHARIILTQINAAKADLMGSKKDCKGKVVVGLSQSCCNVLSIELLTELEHRFANVELSFRIGPSMAVEQWFNDEEVDIALSFNPAGINATQRSIPLIRENLYLYISHHPKNPAYSELALYGSIHFRDLQHYDIFMPVEQDAMYRLLTEQAQKSGIKLKPKNAFGQLMTTLHYVTQGFGLAVLPSSGAFHLETSNQIRAINIVQPALQRDVYLQMIEKKSQDVAVISVFELIREVTASMHNQQFWRGSLLDKKYARPSRMQLETLAAG